jgi:formate dehydrogenase subunit beta
MSTPNQIAKEILQNGKAAVVVGYCEGTIPGKAQTHFAKTPEQADKFIFNKYCINNLAVYLTKSYKLPKPIGVFLKPCDSKTVVSLIQEKQIKREDVFIIGLTCEGVY